MIPMDDKLTITDDSVTIEPGSSGEFFISNDDLMDYRDVQHRNIEMEILRAASKADMLAFSDQEVTGVRIMWHPAHPRRRMH
jgi:hypothetical protein